jgi:hypothetical protein
MKILRPQTVKTGIIAIVCFGVMAVMGLPAKASQPLRGIANWLQSLAGNKPSSQSAGKLKPINRLKRGDNTLFRKASKMISGNNKDFTFQHNATQKTIHHSLTTKRHQRRRENAMSTLPTIKTNSAIKSNKKAAAPLIHRLMAPENADAPLFGEEVNGIIWQPISKSSFIHAGNQIIPLVNKISIGAP